MNDIVGCLFIWYLLNLKRLITLSQLPFFPFLILQPQLLKIGENNTCQPARHVRIFFLSSDLLKYKYSNNIYIYKKIKIKIKYKI